MRDLKEAFLAISGDILFFLLAFAVPALCHYLNQNRKDK